MPKEAPNRWEGTQTYKKPEAEKRRARTVAQLREEAAAKSKASRDAAVNKRRGSISGGPTTAPAGRRGSTGGILTTGEAKEDNSVPGSASGSDMPGSGKKRQGSGESGGGGVDPALRDFLNAMKQDIVQSTKETVGQIEARLDRNEKSIAALDAKIESVEKGMGERIAAEVEKRCAPAIAAMVAVPDKTVAVSSRLATRREEAYERCRRSLKMWPVEGEDLGDAVRVFLHERLKIGDEKIRSMGGIIVSPPSTKAARDKKEVVAMFEVREDRDFIKAQGGNLAGQREVGMALHVPGHLLDNLAALNGLAYAIKQRNPGLKRAVKFDDAVQDVYLDMCIAGNWRRVTPPQAKLALKDTPSTGGDTGTLDASILSDLLRGKDVPGITVAVVPEDGMDE